MHKKNDFNHSGTLRISPCPLSRMAIGWVSNYPCLPEGWWVGM
jgi:hypothetical protein